MRYDVSTAAGVIEASVAHMTAPLATFLSSSGILRLRLFEIVTVLPSRMVLMASSPRLPPLGPRAASKT